MSDIQIRSIAADEYEAWFRSISLAFNSHPILENVPAYRRTTTDPDRTLAAFEDGEIVGGATSYGWNMTIPGGSAPVAAIDGVGVLPTHRRRGILTSMMEQQLRDVYERAEPLAALIASESGIYGRFGYGIASWSEDWKIAREHAALVPGPEPPGRVRFLDRSEAGRVFPGVYDKVRSDRVGMTRFQDNWWDFKLADLEQERRGFSANFHVAYEEDGEAWGYATYRIKEDTLMVVELMAATASARRALWSYCFGVDLISSISARRRATDDPLPWMLAESRRLERTIHDYTWLRLVDVAAALSIRRYDREDELVLEVRDGFCDWNEGRLHLAGGPDGAECLPTGRSPDLAVWADNLAATYLGAVRFTTLAGAERVRELTPGALRRADAMFVTPHQPWARLP